jgi:hypothetical protein
MTKIYVVYKGDDIVFSDADYKKAHAEAVKLPHDGPPSKRGHLYAEEELEIKRG